jgi:asparagine synthase (glutamine-hydrolysing)
MCGIAGWVAPPSRQSAERAEAMVHEMFHRGPDDHGVERIARDGRDITLISRRLAIVDLSPAGHMPMHNPDTGDWIAFNGEIYNFQDIRAELQALGVTFRSTGDTEVILRAYERWGLDCVTRLRGMFAFALWDARKGELILARDRAGKKPLYYSQIGSGETRQMLFASEVRTLLASGLIERKLNPAALEIYLYNGHMIAPETIIRNVYSLMPSTWMRVGPDGEIRQTHRYWYPPLESDGTEWARDREGVLEQVREAMADAVKCRLISDVPLGAFLSGGLDSSAVVALMSRASGDVRTFSIVFDEASFDESKYSRWVAQKFNTRHTEVRITHSDFVSVLPLALDAMDQPSYDGPNTFTVSKAARESGMTVALSGLGGDEVFGGYHEFRVGLTYARLRRALTASPFTQKVGDALGRLQPTAPRFGPHTLELAHYDRHVSLNGSDALVAANQLLSIKFNWWARQRLIQPDARSTPAWFGLPEPFVRFISEPHNEAPPLGSMSRLTSYVMMGERLMRDMDTMSMGVSLETRAPLTDYRFIETAWKIPSAFRCAGAPEKPMEMEVVKPFLGADYPYHRKQGFVFPFERWVRESELYRMIEATLNDHALVTDAGLSSQEVRTLTQRDSGASWFSIWTLFALVRWCQSNRVRL